MASKITHFLWHLIFVKAVGFPLRECGCNFIQLSLSEHFYPCDYLCTLM